MPEYAVGRQAIVRGRSATGRTAVPRDEAVQAAPARQTDRRAERREEASTQAPRDETSDDTAAWRARPEHRGTPTAAEPARTSSTNSPRISQPPSSITPQVIWRFHSGAFRLCGGGASVLH